MKVSIIIPIFNVEKYLSKCLESVIKQTLKDIEIICINNGSTDNSLNILEEYSKKDGRIQIINISDVGVSKARNLGIQAAKGEYLGFVDSDDWVDKDYFEKMYEAAKKYNAEIACAGFRRCKSGNGTIRKKFKKHILTCKIDEKVKLDNIPEHNYIWNKIYKREDWIKTGIMFPENRIFEDVAVVLKLLNSLNFMVTVPNTYYHYRRRTNSIVTQNNKTSKIDFDISQKEMYKYAEENGIDIKPRNSICQKKYVKILGIKVFKIKYYPRKIKYLLFGFIPFATVDLV